MRERLEACRVSVDARLVDAMRAIDRSGVGVALAVDAEGRLLGLLTDGDLRRALLSGAPLDAPLAAHLQRRFTSVREGSSRAEVLDLMRALGHSQIPILNARDQVAGLHLLHDIIWREPRPNWAVVMAGGRGTRLRPLTEAVPKPMLRVAGRPILERLVLHLVSHGLQEIFLAVHHLGDVIEQHFGDGREFGCRVEYIREERPLGTGGALARLPRQPQHPLLVLNGDLVTQADLSAMLAFHEGGGQLATMAVRAYAHEIPFGCVETSGDRVVRLDEKPRMTALINAGIYVLDPALARRVPRDDAEYSLPLLLQECLARDEAVRAFELLDDWLDVGRHEALERARGDV